MHRLRRWGLSGHIQLIDQPDAARGSPTGPTSHRAGCATAQPCGVLGSGSAGLAVPINDRTERADQMFGIVDLDSRQGPRCEHARSSPAGPPARPRPRCRRGRRARTGPFCCQGGVMLARQRQERILEQIQLTGGARVSDLVELLGVSDMTVRRDIAELARRGLVARVHGGATAVSGRSTEEPGFEAKFSLQTGQKAAIARAAAALVSPGDSVAVSAGTTTYAVALELRAVPDLTVVTNSIPVADLLHAQHRDDLRVLLTGGTRTPSDALVGPLAVAALRSLHVDWLFLGVHGVDERAGLTTPNLVEAETNRALIASARRV